jgi:release factor glutamine methyltransferase
MQTIQQYVLGARARLCRAGVPDAEADLDARLLARHALGWDAVRLLSSYADAAPHGFGERFEAIVARRAAREPMAYITGTQEFWGLSFEVTAAVLIPRPETEIIVEAALELFPVRDQPLRIADVGTGSGCLAIALASERPHARVAAIDVSAAALEVAARNAARHRVDGRVAFVHGNLLDNETLERPGFDLIVSNPPYVPDGDRPRMQPEVRDHEPAAALYAGPDGLAVVSVLVPQAVGRLGPNGYLVFEIGIGQADAVERLISATAGLTMVAVRNDLQGIPRAVIARRTS